MELITRTCTHCSLTAGIPTWQVREYYSLAASHTPEWKLQILNTHAVACLHTQCDAIFNLWSAMSSFVGENFLTINFPTLLPSSHHHLSYHLHNLCVALMWTILLVGGGPQVFPLPPGTLDDCTMHTECISNLLLLTGQGFPWAHSTRGKPRRGMMRRAVFSGKTQRTRQTDCFDWHIITKKISL